jgi:ABC-2 type transport system ATP-binding protein
MNAVAVSPKPEFLDSDQPQGAATVEAIDLVRRFGAFTAVDHVSFNIPGPALVAFLGPNGAGKSTTMRLLTGFLAPTSGSARIGGLDVQARRQEAMTHLGYLPENGPLHPEMTPPEILRFFGRARGLAGVKLAERMEAVIGQTQLGEVLGRPAGKLSKGYRQRVGMAVALLHDPAVLILDEPTAGLDPRQVDQVRTLLGELARTRVILLSTHILSEVRAMAQRIIMISGGRLVHDGPAGSLGGTEREMEQRFRALTGAEKV